MSHSHVTGGGWGGVTRRHGAASRDWVPAEQNTQIIVRDCYSPLLSGATLLMLNCLSLPLSHGN